MAKPSMLPTIALSAALAWQGAAAEEGTGQFSGRSGHEASGAVALVDTGSGWEVQLGDDFVFDGAPDPFIGLGRGGIFVPATDFEPLRADSGAQVYRVPDDLDPAGFDTVVLWCRQFVVPLAVAAIE